MRGRLSVTLNGCSCYCCLCVISCKQILYSVEGRHAYFGAFIGKPRLLLELKTKILRATKIIVVVVYASRCLTKIIMIVIERKPILVTMGSGFIRAMKWKSMPFSLIGK